MNIVRAVQTCRYWPAQWDAWTDTGQYLYLRFRSGHGTVEARPTPDWEQWDPMVDAVIAQFEDDDPYGDISLAEFCELAGLTIAEGADLT